MKTEKVQLSKTTIEVVNYYKHKIKRSGFVVDEDLDAIFHFEEWNIDYLIYKKIPHAFYTISLIWFGFSYLLFRKRLNWTTCTIGAIATPTLSYLSISAMEVKLKYSLKKYFDELLEEFRNLSIIQHEIEEFFKSFLLNMSNEELISNSSKTSLFELAKTSYECQFSVACDLRNFFNELSNTKMFDDFTPAILKQNSIKAFLHNENLIEGFIITLRSSLLTNIYYWCIKNPEFALENMNKNLPKLVESIKTNIKMIKLKMHLIHTPKKISPNFENVENVSKQKEIANLGKLKRIIKKLIHNVYFTMLQTESVLESVEKVQEKNDLVLIENNLKVLSGNISECFVSISEFTKLLEVLNGRSDNQLITEQQSSKDDSEEKPYREPVYQNESHETLPSSNLEEDLRFQVFESSTIGQDKNEQESNSDDDFHEFGINEKSKFDDLKYSEWLMELKQSGAFKKRQTVFKIDTNEPAIEHDEKSIGQVQLTPPPPTIALRTENSLKDAPVPLPPPLPPPMLFECEEQTVIQNSLQGALSKFNIRQEDTFE